MKPSTTVRASRSRLPIRARTVGSTNRAPGIARPLIVKYLPVPPDLYRCSRGPHLINAPVAPPPAALAVASAPARAEGSGSLSLGGALRALPSGASLAPRKLRQGNLVRPGNAGQEGSTSAPTSVVIKGV